VKASSAKRPHLLAVGKRPPDTGNFLCTLSVSDESERVKNVDESDV
jgi:hypothetical protein